MAVVIPFNFILLASTWADNLLLWMVVFDTSNNESISERLPEFLLPNAIGVYYLMLLVVLPNIINGVF